MTTFWYDLATVMLESVIGRSNSPLGGAPDPYVWDEGNTINITLIDTANVLSSITEAELFEGFNLAAIGNEVIQWKTSTLEADGSYTLSRLRRGCNGTEWACGSHLAGENFVVIDLSKLVVAKMISDDLDRTVRFKSTSIGMPVDSSTITSSPIYLRNLKPLSVVHIAAMRDGAGEITMTWIRRTRNGGEWRDSQDIILGEISELYEVDIYDGSTLVRTITGLITPVYTYSVTDQTTDFGSVQSAVDVDIYQVSNAIGRGFGSLATI